MSDASATRLEPIALSAESTVVAEFVADPAASAAYQSESEIERELMRLLEEQAYERLAITSEAALVSNLRMQLELLNDIRFSDSEWQRFFSTRIASENDTIAEKTVRIHEDHVQLLLRDDGTTKNVRLIDKQHVHANRLQVINQYEVDGARANRYDVTCLLYTSDAADE